jgi:hypothetical protein
VFEPEIGGADSGLATGSGLQTGWGQLNLPWLVEAEEETWLVNWEQALPIRQSFMHHIDDLCID